ncbi:RNA-binding protein [Sulfitobacter sp. HNIBRBA2951]|uniref:RNA-binding protein n=1 Tax=Sulfitobacter aquimarinus TaxID=3158557 RepID=UPI0032DFF8CF
MGRGGASKDRESGAERKCIATGEVQPKYRMVRFVIGPDGQVVPDILGKLPARGIWVTADRAALEAAVKKGAFARSAKQPAKVPDDLVAEVERQLARRTVDLISMQRKAGKAVAGYEKVKTWLQTEEALVLIQAVDGSGRGKSKLSTPHYGHYIGCLTADELGLAFGRQTVIHGALASGGLTLRVVEEAHRLNGVRKNEAGIDQPKG